MLVEADDEDGAVGADEAPLAPAARGIEDAAAIVVEEPSVRFGVAVEEALEAASDAVDADADADADADCFDCCLRRCFWCTLLCRLRSSLRAKRRPQTSQGKGRSPANLCSILSITGFLIF